MAGCDFVKALPGIGIRKAHAHMRRLRSFVKVLPLDEDAFLLLNQSCRHATQVGVCHALEFSRVGYCSPTVPTRPMHRPGQIGS